MVTLVDENLKPGTYEINWNASNYPSGVYFYKIEIVETTRRVVFTETKKMLRIK
ncbi:MAG TPA: hypothetical protein VGK25_09405 [Ignavibacteria bacterium]